MLLAEVVSDNSFLSGGFELSPFEQIAVVVIYVLFIISIVCLVLSAILGLLSLILRLVEKLYDMRHPQPTTEYHSLYDNCTDEYRAEIGLPPKDANSKDGS